MNVYDNYKNWPRLQCGYSIHICGGFMRFIIIIKFSIQGFSTPPTPNLNGNFTFLDISDHLEDIK